jgi:hypothetical protein
MVSFVLGIRRWSWYSFARNLCQECHQRRGGIRHHDKRDQEPHGQQHRPRHTRSRQSASGHQPTKEACWKEGWFLYDSLNRHVSMMIGEVVLYHPLSFFFVFVSTASRATVAILFSALAPSLTDWTDRLHNSPVLYSTPPINTFPPSFPSFSFVEELFVLCLIPSSLPLSSLLYLFGFFLTYTPPLSLLLYLQ